ncbi:hypothetical protein EXU57_24305 [Segetibacter sp. 3557_3]|uniref:transposase n=1 Tax=Segetibacter sp. 3557_3 TaxID=2547429 RepID=UPI0010583EFC|nr:transposase [Segetibacter sp. 3557_3]TDH18176.1 hypothetical protein EXU57_24305 [Segetibacter sp. 3557_3]
MHERLQTNKAKRLKKLRSSTVEPVIGTLVNFLAMKRVNTRGIIQANKCLLMAAVAYNVKKLLNWKDNNRKTNVKEMEIKIKKFVFELLCYYHHLLIIMQRSIQT